MTSDGRQAVADTQASAEQSQRRGASTRRTQSRVLVLPETLSVQRLAELIDQSPIDVIKQLMRNGIMAGMNQIIDYEMATLVTTAFGIRTTMAKAEPAAASAARSPGKSKTPPNKVRGPRWSLSWAMWTTAKPPC